MCSEPTCGKLVLDLSTPEPSMGLRVLETEQRFSLTVVKWT